MDLNTNPIAGTSSINNPDTTSHALPQSFDDVFDFFASLPTPLPNVSALNASPTPTGHHPPASAVPPPPTQAVDWWWPNGTVAEQNRESISMAPRLKPAESNQGPPSLRAAGLGDGPAPLPQTTFLNSSGISHEAVHQLVDLFFANFASQLPILRRHDVDDMLVSGRDHGFLLNALAAVSAR